MADHISDNSLDLINISLTSELGYLKKLATTVLDEIEQIIIVSLIQSESLKVEEERFEENSNPFAATLTLDNCTMINHCTEVMQDQPEGDNKVENSVRCGVKRKRQRYASSSSSESSSTGSLMLKLRLIKKSEDVKTWSIDQASATCHQSDANPTLDRQRMKVDAEQLQILEESFAACQYIVGKKRLALAERLGLPERQVSNWFEYRRRRMRRMQSESNTSKKASSARSALPPKNIDASVIVKQEPADTIDSTTSARHLQNTDVPFAVKQESFDTFASTNVSRQAKCVDTSSTVKLAFDPFISSVPTWPSKYVDAPSSVKQNSFDTISTHSSDLSTAWDLEHSPSPNDENKFNSFSSRISIEVPPSERSVSYISSSPGNFEENNDFSYPHAEGEDCNLLSVMGLENISSNMNASSVFV